jgi:SAM-dependent methyltransferase
MGLARGSVKFLLEESRRRSLSGSVLTLGRQDVWLTWEELLQAARDLGVRLQPPGEIALNSKAEFKRRRQISDRTLLRALGFARAEALDVSDFESADHIFDLNSAALPDALGEAFDVIVDPGTLEHLFHVPNALVNLHSMLKPGGRIIHISPSSNWIDHGFWMFSPTFFRDYYVENGYEIDALRVFRHRPRPDHRQPWFVYDYQIADHPLARYSYGGLDDSAYGIGCIATKVPGATADRVPQQSRYVREWDGSGPASGREGVRAFVAWLDERSPSLGNAARRLKPLHDRVLAIPRLRVALREELRLKPTARY